MKVRTIAILCGRFLPGYKDGGPVRSLINLLDSLGKEYRFKIITNDRDHGDTTPYPDIIYDQPNIVGNAEVWYLKPGGFKKATIQRLVKDVDLIYIFGPYDDYAYKTMWLKRIGRIKQPLVVASMGSFSQGAYQIKSKKKELYIKACRILGLFKEIRWSVTSELEANDVFRVIGKDACCEIAEDLPRKVPILKSRMEHDNTVKAIFISRICEKKNLIYALNVLASVNVGIHFDIFGVLEDVEYWNKCKERINSLPSRIIVSYRGTADPEKVIELFSEYDFFLFPTMGENYGHVIFESLAGGCIPIISDQTPWNDLEKYHCGKVISLDNEAGFVSEVNRIANLPHDELAQMRIAAHDYAEKKYNESLIDTGYRRIFG